MYFSDPAHNVAQFGLRVGDHVADLGAGVGNHSVALAKVVDISGKVYAVDLQKELLKELMVRAREAGVVNVVPIVADIEKPKGTGLEEGSMDAVLISNTLFQSEDRFAFLKEAHRILKSNGEALIIDWAHSFKGMGPSEKHVVSKDSLIEMAGEVGFALDRTIGAGEHHYGLIFKK
ncbi:MAG: class I SAM-dependent methyltransferase [Candidatus Paceibacterota bacterium]